MLAQMVAAGSLKLSSETSPSTEAHAARLILVLALAPAVGVGLCRFAYSLLLPDMRDSLGWSYATAGFMNTANAAGYLTGALAASPIVRRIGSVSRGSGRDGRLRR